jgi:hypothetical protein
MHDSSIRLKLEDAAEGFQVAGVMYNRQLVIGDL